MGPRWRFTNIQKQLLAPFVVCADFESILQRVGDDEALDTTHGVTADDDEQTTALGPFQEHLPCSFAYKVASTVVPDFSRPLVSYRGEDAGEMSVRKLQEEAEQLFQESSPTTSIAYRGRVALLPHCHQLSHMQPTAGRGQRA